MRKANYKIFLPILPLLCWMIFALTLFSPIIAQDNYKDSLLHQLKNITKADTNKVNALNELAEHIQFNDPDTALILCNQAYALSEKLHFEMGIAKTHHHLGTVNQIKGNYHGALDNYVKALAIWEKLEKEIGAEKGLMLTKAKTIGNIGLAYADQSNFPKALDYYFKGLKIFEGLNDKPGMAVQLSQIGNAFFFLGDYKKALDYQLRSLKLDIELGDKTGISYDYGNLANIYFYERDYAKALDYYERSLKTSEELGNKSALANTLCNMGTVYFSMGDTKKAMAHFTRALKLEEELGNMSGIANNYGNMGQAMMKEKKYKEADIYLKNAIAISDTLNLLNERHVYELAYSSLDSVRGNFEGALRHFKLAIAAKDSVTNEENTRKNVQVQMEYEFSKKEAETRALQEKKDAIANEEKKKQVIIRNSFIGGFILVLMLALMIFRGYRNKQKANLIISKQKEEVELAKEIIEQQKEIVEQKQKEIVDSIYYAQRIQGALITNEKYIARTLSRLRS